MTTRPCYCTRSIRADALQPTNARCVTYVIPFRTGDPTRPRSPLSTGGDKQQRPVGLANGQNIAQQSAIGIGRIGHVT